MFAGADRIKNDVKHLGNQTYFKHWDQIAGHTAKLHNPVLKRVARESMLEKTLLQV